ncbi:MAG: FHA domain-containing protein [Gammaproteobacteria bacterium]
MPKLILSVDDKIIEEYSIDKDTITIGRRIDNDVCLDNLAISGYHSQITTVSNDCFLEDLNSTNGTFVNSKIVKKHALKDGDLIDIGNHRIKYINHLTTNSANSNFEKTVVMSPESSHDKIDASIADLVDQIDAIAAADYVSKPQSSNELEDLEEELLSEELEEYSNSLETLANDGPSDEVESIAPSESTENVETLDSAVGMDDEYSELGKETEFNGSDETLANAERSDPIETAINSDAPEHVGTYDPAETMGDIKDMKSIDTVDPVETMDDMELPDQLEPIDVDQTSTSVVEDDSQFDATENNVGRIQILNGSNTGKELILDKSLTTIGKPGVAVVGITKRNSGYYIIQTEGDENNHANLNNKIIEGKAQKLEAHDIIDVADIKLEYYIN